MAIVWVQEEFIVFSFPSLHSSQFDDLRRGRELLLLDVIEALVNAFGLAFALLVASGAAAVSLVCHAFYDWPW